MKIYIGFDHRGASLAYKVMEELLENGHQVNQPFETENVVDYPDVAKKVCDCIKKDEDSRGVLICGTGIGMNMGANRKKGIRAVLAQTEADAYFSRVHENANVLVLSAGYKDDKFEVKKAKNISKILKTFIETKFDGGRHLSRIEKLDC